MKIVAKQNPLSIHDETTQVLHGEDSHSNLHSVEWRSSSHHSTSHLQTAWNCSI